VNQTLQVRPLFLGQPNHIFLAHAGSPSEVTELRLSLKRNRQNTATHNIKYDRLLECRRNQSEATLTVADLPLERIEAAAARLNCQAETQPLPLEDIYRVVVA